MTTWRLVARSLTYHWRSQLGVLLGAILSTAILVGALAVGDSVRYTLRDMALSRLGSVQLALQGQSRFFRAALASELAPELKTATAAVVLVHGTAASGTTDARAGRVQVIGVDEAFWRLGGSSPLLPAGAEEAVVLNRGLATKLGAKPGDELLLRVEKPAALSRDAPLSTANDATVALRLTVAAVASDAQFGRFSLEANQAPPLNAYVPIRLLQDKLDIAGKANTLLVGAGAQASQADAALRQHWNLADAGLELKTLPHAVELRTEHVFIPAAISDAALRAVPHGAGVLTYFVNDLKSGSHSTPYSSVAALNGEPVTGGMTDDEAVINQWLADDLKAGIGDTLQVTYYVVGPMRRLIEQTSSFRIRAIVPLAGAAADRDLMPRYPGLTDKKNCRDWEPGIPLNLKRIRPQDEKYWTAYKGTPKAFITLAAGQRIWNNRFGTLTAVRYPRESGTAVEIDSRLRAALNPASVGLYFQPVRERALSASSATMDFGQLFLGFSLFLIVAALLLTALLFALGAEQRGTEVGTLLAVGLRPRQVRRLLLMEGAVVAAVGGLLGAALGVVYTGMVVRGLATVWKGAIADAPLKYHWEASTLAEGAVAAFVVALFAIWLVARRQAHAPARELLSGGTEAESRFLAETGKKRPSIVGMLLGFGGLLGGVALVGAAFAVSKEAAAEYFFSGGGLLLLGGIGASGLLLARLSRSEGGRPLSLSSLGLRNSTRRRARSLSVIGLLASGSFLVVSLGAYHQDPNAGALRRTSGTGGFSLYAETSLPVYEDLNTQAGRDVLALDDADLVGAQTLALRLRDGDDASCLNLNKAQVPRILGVAPVGLNSRQAFSFASTSARTGSAPWSVLEMPQPDGAVPVVGDVNTVTWSLGKSLGDTLTITDDAGQPLKLRIAGIIGNSVLQGSLLMSEDNFVQKFPLESGYRAFLIDTQPARAADVSKALLRGLEDVGGDVVLAPARLAGFNAVEETYLSIFAALGGLGLLLGSAGLGVVVLRNTLERRGELALLRAVGFTRRRLQWLVFSEHCLLLFLGLGVGVVAALAAVLPAFLSPTAEVPYISLLGTLVALVISGCAWTWLATTAALRGSLIQSLRSE